MGNMTLFRPEETKTVTAIYDWWQAENAKEEARGYLGASIIGHECDRFLWYTFRQCYREKFEGRILRLFNRGHREEDTFIRELEGIGCKVTSTLENGEQIGVYALGGHFSGHLDGAALGVPEAPATWHVVEYKTHSNKSFEKLKREGVQASKPMHYAQMMSYMGLTKLTRALYLAVNKNTDELYSERIHFVPAEFKAIMARAKRIIEATSAPGRLTIRSDHWQCKFCPAQALCWGQSKVVVPIPTKTCRTCCHATPITAGEGQGAIWHCDRHKKDLATGEVKMACPQHLLLPSLVYGAQPFDAGDDWIDFRNDNGTKWRHGAGGWSTEELAKIATDMLASKGLLAAKEIMDGTVVEVRDSLIDMYPHEDCEKLWDGPANDAAEAVLGIIPTGCATLTRQEDTKDTNATEYAGQYLLVYYKADAYAALWKGKE